MRKGVVKLDTTPLAYFSEKGMLLDYPTQGLVRVVQFKVKLNFLL